MSRQKGSLQHLGGDRWRVRVFGGRSASGKQVTRSRSFRAPSKRAAERKAPTITAELFAELDGEGRPRGSVAELAADWLELKRRQGRSPSTIESYEVIVDRIVERFGRVQVSELGGRDIDRWYGELGDSGVGASTVQHHHAVLRAMLRQAERWDIVGSVATRRSSPPPVPQHEINPPTSAALAVILADASGDFGHALRVIAGTGVRRGELCGLWRSDLVGDQLTIRRSVLELDGGGLHIGPTKGRRPRTMTVGSDVLAALDDQRAHLEAMAAAMGVTLPADGPIFADIRADPTGATPRRPGWLSGRWGKLRARHGMGGVRLHDLRHWNATTLLDMGVPLPVVSERLGHAQTSTTLNIYGHAVPRSDRAAAELIAGVLG